MNSIARRLLVGAVRALLPEAVPDDPGTALVLRPQGQYAPPPRMANARPVTDAPQQFYAPCTPVPTPEPPRPRRRKVVITETYFEEEW